MTAFSVKKILEMRSFLLINLVVLFFLSLSFGRTFLRNASIQREIDALESEKAELESQNIALLSLADQLQTKFYLEKEGRKKYGLQRDGERLVIVTETATSPAPSTTETTEGQEDTTAATTDDASQNNLGRWWAFFFDAQAYESFGGEE